MDDLTLSSAADRLASITGHEITARDFEKFERFCGNSSHPIEITPNLSGWSRYTDVEGPYFLVTFTYKSRSETVDVQRSHPLIRYKEPQVVTSALNALVYLIENPSSGIRTYERYRSSRNLL